MDELVLKAMARWPQVPAVFGWLRLDARGNWWLVQRDLPSFSETEHGKGSPITSPPITDFIWRNLDADTQGRWFWQNGPQRVFIDLERAPLILRVVDDSALTAPLKMVGTNGDLLQVFSRALLDANDGGVYLLTESGPAFVDDRYLARLEPRIGSLALDEASINIGTAQSPQFIKLESVQDAALALGFCRAPIGP
jgi:Protein of unknown function (DUF2946)